MHTIMEIRVEYDRLDRLLGVDTSQIAIEISRRAVSQLGCFRTKPPRITVAKFVLEQETLFWDTIRHEYAHAVLWLQDPEHKHGHDTAWKAICQRIGCRPSSRSPVTEDGLRQRQSCARYQVTCLGCGKTVSYLRRGKVVTLLETGREDALRCSSCGNSRFSLTKCKP